MSAADEDTELRDLLVQTLDKNGILGKIKAELRASVFLALEAEDHNKNSSPLTNQKFQKFLKDKDSGTCIDIILEFLQFFNLEYTAAVFGPETNNSILHRSRESVCQKLHLQDDAPHLPVLACCVKSRQGAMQQNTNTTPTARQMQRAKELFAAKDRANLNSISSSDVVDVFSFLCPMFPVFLIDKFVSEETSSALSSRISWNDFICLYEKFYTACQSVVSDSEIQSSQFPSQLTSFHKDQSIESPPEREDSLHNVATAPGTSVPAHYLRPSDDSISDVNQFYDDCLQLEPQHQQTNTTLRTASTRKLPPLGGAATSPSKIPIRVDDTSSGKESAHKLHAPSSVKHSMDYEDDFEGDDGSITEDIPDVVTSTSSSSLIELTEDRTLDEKSSPLDADYMEEAKIFSTT